MSTEAKANRRHRALKDQLEQQNDHDQADDENDADGTTNKFQNAVSC
ncbi:hypothetical protein [Rhizobium sp. FY34]|nr:hypothetical protein [Rhizobium sp. FY34]